MKVALVCMIARGAMGQYARCLARRLRTLVSLDLHAPAHFLPDETVGNIIPFDLGGTRISALLSLCNPIKAREFSARVLGGRPDVVHIFNGEGYPWARQLAGDALEENIPLIVTVHDPQPHPGNLWEWANSRLRDKTIRCATVIHTHSRTHDAALSSLGAGTVERRCVIPHGDLSELFPKELPAKSPATPAEVQLLLLGRLEPYKGIATLLDAMSLLPANFNLIIAGPGKLASSDRRHAEKLGKRVQILQEYLDNARVSQLFQSSSVCVLPYYQASQSSVPMLAARFLTPVVATNVGALGEDAELVGGMTVAPRDPAALARAIEAMVGKASHSPASRSFDCLAPQFCDMYRRAIQLGAQCRQPLSFNLAHSSVSGGKCS